jgi:hypothetical protein
MSNIFNYFDNVIVAASKTQAGKQLLYNEEELKNLLNSDYSEAFSKAKQGHIIYRGAKKYDDSSEFLGLLYTPGKRISENTSNVYTKLLSDLFPSWQKFPKRNKSVIASFDINKAADYVDINGMLYIVLPKNGARIGICPKKDIWNSFDNFPSSISNLSQFNSAFCYLVSEICQFSGNIKNKNKVEKTFLESTAKVKELFKDFDKGFTIQVEKARSEGANNAEQLFNYFDQISDGILGRRKIEILHDYINYYGSKNGKTTFLKFLEELYFDNSDFSIQTTSSLNNNGYSEVWIEGPCLFIPNHMWKKIKKF